MISRGRWVFDSKRGRLVRAETFYARKAAEVAVSALPFPMVMSDQIELRSQVDGKIYTSKSTLRRHYRERGYVEVGNEYLRNEPKPPKKQSQKKQIKDSLGRAFNRVGVSL